MWQMRLWDFVTIQRSFLQAGSIPGCPFLCSECPVSAADGCGAECVVKDTGMQWAAHSCLLLCSQGLYMTDQALLHPT